MRNAVQITTCRGWGAGHIVADAVHAPQLVVYVTVTAYVSVSPLSTSGNLA